MIRLPACIVLLVAAAVVSGHGRAAPRARPSAACGTVVQQDRLVAVMETGELQLGSRAVVKLSAIRLPDDAERRGEALARLQALVGRPVAVGVVSGPDRWGRIEAEITVSDDSSLLIARDLVQRGLAIVDAGTAEALCRPELLAVEAAARGSGLGVWDDGRYKPLASRAPAGWRERAGQFVLVEGQVWSVGERRQRSYLNLGPNRADDVTITVPKPTWTMMAARGMSAEALRGRRIRARGILEDWGGPILEITAMDVIEVLDQDRTRR